jgi:hypothetical protein
MAAETKVKSITAEENQINLKTINHEEHEGSRRKAGYTASLAVVTAA